MPSSLSNKNGSIEGAYTRALTAKLGKGEDIADMIVASQGSLVMDDGWVQKPRTLYDLEANPSPIVMEVRVNSGLVPIVFDVDDPSAAVKACYIRSCVRRDGGVHARVPCIFA